MISSKLSKSLSLKGFGEFEQLSPLHSPHAGVHCNPCFLQVHLLDSQPVLQLHLKIRSRSFGAGGMSVFTGISSRLVISQPHSSGSKCLASPLHS